MKISEKWLKEKSACEEGIQWFLAQKETDGLKMERKSRMTIHERIMRINLGDISQEDLDWLHELKTRAAVMSGWLQLKDLKAQVEGDAA